MLWKKKNEADKCKLILGMVMLADVCLYNFNDFRDDFNNNYTAKIDELIEGDDVVVFHIDGERIAISAIDVPIPQGDITTTAEYAYNWPTAVNDLEGHTAHIIVSFFEGESNQVKRYRIFTQVICSILRVTNAIGVYKGNQTLLIPKDAYLSIASYMTENTLPLNLWIYFGFRVSEDGNCGYTYGLNQFNKNELEILDSKRSFDDINYFLYDLSHYVLSCDVVFKNGQTCGLENEKVKISLSNGVLVEGESFKLGY
jgi:hypothetical protein